MRDPAFFRIRAEQCFRFARQCARSDLKQTLYELGEEFEERAVEEEKQRAARRLLPTN